MPGVAYCSMLVCFMTIAQVKTRSHFVKLKWYKLSENIHKSFDFSCEKMGGSAKPEPRLLNLGAHYWANTSLRLWCLWFHCTGCNCRFFEQKCCCIKLFRFFWVGAEHPGVEVTAAVVLRSPILVLMLVLLAWTTTDPDEGAFADTELLWLNVKALMSVHCELPQRGLGRSPSRKRFSSRLNSTWSPTKTSGWMGLPWCRTKQRYLNGSVGMSASGDCEKFCIPTTQNSSTFSRTFKIQGFFKYCQNSRTFQGLFKDH